MAERIIYTLIGTEQMNCIIMLGNFAICEHQTFRSDYVKDHVGRVCSMNEKNVSKNKGIIFKWIFLQTLYEYVYFTEIFQDGLITHNPHNTSCRGNTRWFKYDRD